MTRPTRSALLLLLLAVPSFAQQIPHAAPKPTLTSADYAKWETLGSGALSPDGKWVAYDFRRGNGSAEVRYRSLDVDKEQTARSASTPQFTTNSRWLLYTIVPDTMGGARGERGRGGTQLNGAASGARNKVGIVDLRRGTTTVVDDIQSYSVSNDGAHVAFRRYAAPGRRGADVIVRDLETATDLTFGNVAEQKWSDDGSLLAMAIDVPGGTGNGIQLLDVKTSAIRSLDASDKLYAGLEWRDHAQDLAAFRSRTDSTFADTSYVVIAWRGLGANATKSVYDFSTDASFPQLMRVASYRPLAWSDDGARLFFGTAPHDPRIVPGSPRPGELPPARVQVWHSRDLREFHQQQVNANQDRQRTTLAAWRVGAPSVVHLSSDPFETVLLSDNGAAAIALDEGPYPREYMSGRQYRDVYRVELGTGKRDKVIAKSLYGASLSPSGRYVIYQQQDQWWSLDLTTGASSNLTGKSGSVFVNMEDDHPLPERRAYGVAGFTTSDNSVVLYDRFDLWQVHLDGSGLTRLTHGREDSTVYRCVSEGAGFGPGAGRGEFGAAARSAPCQPGHDSRTIDPTKPLVLSAFGEFSKKSGYARLTIGKPAQRLAWADKMFTALRKAKDADVYLFEQQSFEESPNYFVAGPSLDDAKAVSHTNAFQSEVAWGKQVLMDYTNGRGNKLQMMLVYPANYEPGKKYPMVVYYYEKLSNGFHQYVTPSDRSPYNTSVFSQNGYFVLRPDIVFEKRNPGYSGLDCVTSAVREVLGKVPDIDAAHVGNMGHSWGGYQSAFYAVHNPGIFAATIAGAPLTDLISMYGYTSGNSGLPETGHYETSQERMEVPLWEDPQAYIRNSTVYAVDSLHTPLLLEEGDADGNVNHFQSEELYNFGRRLGKNVVYLVYEGENHNVARPESQADYLRRQLEWFAHYLKGQPAAPWITDGESYLTRQRILTQGAGDGSAAVQAGAPAGRPITGRP